MSKTVRVEAQPSPYPSIELPDMEKKLRTVLSIQIERLYKVATQSRALEIDQEHSLMRCVNAYQELLKSDLTNKKQLEKEFEGKTTEELESLLE